MTGTDHELLVAAISEGAASAPDPDEVLRTVRVRVARRRRRRLAGTAVLAVASVIVVLGSLAMWPGGPPRTTPHVAASPAVKPVPPQRCTLLFGWLPPGLEPPFHNCGPTGERVLYPMNGGNYLNVSVDSVSWQPALDTPGLQQIQVGGRPAAIASKPTRTILLFQLPSGHWVQVEYGNGRPGSSSSSTQQATLRNDALAIANGMSEGTAEEVHVAFAPGYLPAGMRLTKAGTDAAGLGSLDYDDGTGTLTKVELGGTEDGIPTSDVVTDERHTINISLGSADPTLTGKYGSPVGQLGNLTIYSINHDRAVVVPGFHGAVLWISTDVNHFLNLPRPAPLSIDELIKIAQHVQWFG